jgi:hypothetical protein
MNMPMRSALHFAMSQAITLQRPVLRQELGVVVPKILYCAKVLTEKNFLPIAFALG